mgnify:CR=1 FL=1
MKRLISILLALILILSTGITVSADGWGNGKVPKGLLKKVFDDIDGFEWAEKAIEKMFQKGLIKGIGDGKFAPKDPVTKLEIIIMALRVIRWEDDAKKIKELPKQYKGERIDDWAIGYVSLAYQKGILDEVDMMYFKPLDYALRHEVAKYVIRALGYEKEAQRNMNKKLPFVDASLVPQGSVGYIYLMNEFGLMVGDNQNRINPLGTMNRAEMATLFSRVDDKVDTGKNETVTGEIVQIYNDRILIKDNNNYMLYYFDASVKVYEKNRRIDVDNLKIGSKVKLEIKNGKVVFIEVIDRFDDVKIVSKFAGTVLSINKTKPYRLTIKSETMIAIFEVVDDVDVIINNRKSSFSNIENNDKITVMVDRLNRVIRVEATR